ncbi:MAG: DMT family transporter [Bacteroidetes bacterium]|jgi:transporter family-2 protein|nr:DMT family transporter [Bacteroidota bacterium]
MNSTFYTFMTLAVGTCLPVMAAANGSLGKTLGSPFIATLLAFIVASCIITTLIAVTRTPLPSTSQFLSTNWRMWIGGVIIAMNILVFTIVPQKIGVGNTVTFFVAGQIVSSMLIESFGWLNYQPHPVNWARIGGVMLLITGVVLIKKF